MSWVFQQEIKSALQSVKYNGMNVDSGTEVQTYLEKLILLIFETSSTGSIYYSNSSVVYL